MKTSSKVIVIILVLVGVGIFGYTQYASASQIGVTVTQSELLEENEYGSTYNVELQFENPSLLALTAGDSTFFVLADNQTVGQGELEPFVLPPLGSSMAKGTYQTEPEGSYNDDATLKISGSTKYDMLFTSLEIPFVLYPDKEQIREFIDDS